MGIYRSLAFRLFSILLIGLMIIGMNVWGALLQLKNQAADNAYVSATLKVELAVSTLQRDIFEAYNSGNVIDLEDITLLEETMRAYMEKVASDEVFSNNETITTNINIIHDRIRQVERDIETLNATSDRGNVFRRVTINVMSLTDLLEENKVFFVQRVRQTTKN